MDIQLLHSLYRVDSSSPSGVVFNGDRKRGTAKDGRPALATLTGRASGLVYYRSAYTDCSGPVKRRVHLYAHRVVFALLHGYWPETVDHIDGNTLNNTPSNLRAATLKQQQGNKRVFRTSKTGIKGVQYAPWKNHTNPWLVKCQGRYVGMFATAELAQAAQEEASRIAYGEFNSMA